MNHLTGRLISLALLLIITITAGTWCKKDISDTYSENLAVHRKRLKTTKIRVKKTGLVTYKKKIRHTAYTHTINDQLDYLLARKKSVHEQAKYIHGYTIQVYSGSSREEAFRIKNKLYTRYPIIAPEVSYHLTNYTVCLGRFLDRSEAYPAYATVRKIIPQAIIRPIYFVNQSDVFTNKQTTNQSSPISSAVTGNDEVSEMQRH